MEEVVPKMAAPICTNISRLNVVVQSPPLYPRGEPKWRNNYPEGPDHPVSPNRLHVGSLRMSSCKDEIQLNREFPALSGEIWVSHCPRWGDEH